jgi:hypothetical protein
MAIDLKASHQWLANRYSTCTLVDFSDGLRQARNAGKITLRGAVGAVARRASWVCAWGTFANADLANTLGLALDRCPNSGVKIGADLLGRSWFIGCQGSNDKATPHWHLRAFDSAGNCTSYVGDVSETTGQISNRRKVGYCGSAPGAGPMESYTAFVIGGQLREALWRDGTGYVRHSQLVGGQPDDRLRNGWVECCQRGQGVLPDAPLAGQSTVTVGSKRYTRVFEVDGTCHEWQGEMSGSGFINNEKRPYCSGSGLLPALSRGEYSHDVTSYTSYIVGDRLYEGMWSNDKGYVRQRRISSETGDVIWHDNWWWEQRLRWTQCCDAASIGYVSNGQDGFVLWHD